MDEIKAFLEKETGESLGAHVEIPFNHLGGRVKLKNAISEYAQAAKRRVKRENPIAPNQADIVKWVLYDRFIFAPGTVVPNNFKFFTQPIGTNGKTKIDTNLDQVQRLPDPIWFNTEGVEFYFSNRTNPIDLQAFFDSEYMEYWVGQKVYLEGPLQVFPGGAGMFGNLAGGAINPNFAIISNGFPMTSNVYDVRLPAGIHLGVDASNTPIVTDGLIGITILQGQQFKIEMNAPLGGIALTAASAEPFAGGGLTIMAYLYGILSRGVQ